MSISFTWFANANTTIQNSVVQAPSLDTCLIVGFFPKTDVAAFANAPVVQYADYASFNADFGSVTPTPTGDQADWYGQLDIAVKNFFNQKGASPDKVLIGRIDPADEATALAGTNPDVFVSTFLSMKANSPSWYGFTIADHKPCKQSAITTGVSSGYINFINCVANALSAIKGAGYKAFYFESTSDYDVFNPTSATNVPMDVLVPFVKNGLIKAIDIAATTINLLYGISSKNIDVNQILKIDDEFMRVTSFSNVSNVITVGVTRAFGGSNAAAHNTGADVIFIPSLNAKITISDTALTVFLDSEFSPTIPTSGLLSVYTSGNPPQQEFIRYSSFSRNASILTFNGLTRGVDNTTPVAFDPTNVVTVQFYKDVSPTYINPAKNIANIYANPNWALFYHSKNCTTTGGGVNSAAAVMGAYFLSPKGTTLSRLQLAIPADNLSRNQLDAATAAFVNTYAGFSATGGNAEVPQGLVQYGHCVTSTSTNIYYVDQVYTADYAEVNSEADMATTMLGNKVFYDDMGIQLLVASVRKTFQAMVDADMLMPFSNRDITYTPYSKVPVADITNRVYGSSSSPGIIANLIFKSHIQKVTFNINIRLI